MMEKKFMEQKALKIGVIGTGNMGANHVRVLSSELHYFDLAGVYDSDPLRAKRMEERYGVKAFEDSAALLDSVTQRIFVPQQEPLREELLSFYLAVREGVPVAVDGGSATEAIRICEEVLK